MKFLLSPQHSVLFLLERHSPPRYDALVADLFADNLRRYLAGERLRNLVDWSLGY